ncbi:hypothetical protein MSAN_01162200 [Mycena sanguinolenta]|uniref:Uncharacterized protein n=1 Tax=Mycena sanguinolenta TaxID=230812 RepID=A0A8H6YMC7_9AGAR|nr:hypothetical protein MSAN_01162200 [Mycena sanguinolenta]
MEKIASVLAAVDAGKLPSTEQLNSLDHWLTHSAFPPVEPSDHTQLSEQGAVLANDIREILISYNLINAHKKSLRFSDDNLLQEAIWHLTEGDVNTTDSSRDAEVSSDINAVRSSIRTILSIFWHNFTDGGFLPTDVTSFILLTLSDAAEVVQSQAGRTKDSLRQMEQEVQEGQRDSLGRDKQRLGEEEDKRVAFEHTMDTLKDVGSGAIGAHRSVKAKAGDISERASGLLWDTYYTACERARNDPVYHSALSTLFNVLHKIPPPTSISTKALDALKILLDRFVQPECSVDDLLNKTDRFVSAMRGNSGEFKAWVDKFFEHVHRSLDDPEYPSSDEAYQVGSHLRTRRRELLDPDTEPGRAWIALQETAQTFGAAVIADSDVRRVHAAHMQLGNDMKNAFVEAGTQAALEGPTWFWSDLFSGYVPRILSMLKDIPIPRTEYVDSDIEFVLENLDISSFAVNPAHISIHNTTSVDVLTSETSKTTTGVGTFTHIRLQAVQLALKDGLDVEIHLRRIQSVGERKAKHGYYRVERLEVQIADEVKIKVRQSNHAVVLSLFKPIVNKRLREALSRSLAEQFRAALDAADGIAWDVGRRAEVFADTGLARGAALAAAVWSEIGHLIRERSWSVRATGTGVVVEAGAQDADGPKFAMGAEPQILPGEKRGPLGTGSESLEHQAGRAADSFKRSVDSDADAKTQLNGAVGEGKGQVQSFRRSIEEKAAMERKNPGWKSTAFDI